MIKRFKETHSSTVANGMATVICPDCHWAFGLSNSFIEKIGDANCHFNCPYCGKEHGLQKND